jgi:hypothetical protein
MSKSSPRDVTYLTPGKITALWQVILLARKYPSTHISEIIKILRGSSLRGGGLPVDDGVEVGLAYKLFSIEKGKLNVSDFANEKLLNNCSTEEPNSIVLKEILAIVIKTHNFHWLINFNVDATVFKISIPENWIDLLDLANLFDFSLSEVLEWWKDLIYKYNIYRDENNKKTGEVGENLTMIFENSRLSDDGFENTELIVLWASQLSDRFGYDVKSIRGALHLDGLEKEDPVFIEVKSSSYTTTNNFIFHLTKKEWEIASDNLGSYYFYCWTNINTSKVEGIGPYIIKAEQIKEHIPKNVSMVCEWTECRFTVNLEDMAIAKPQ